MNATRLAIAAAYVVSVTYPTYLAGSAPGEPITATRLALYAAAVIVSGVVGIALRPVAWRYALPWFVAGALLEADLLVEIAADTTLFGSTESYLPLALLAATEAFAMWGADRLLQRLRRWPQ